MNYHERKRWVFLGLALLSLTAFVWYKTCFSFTEKEAYQAVLARANPSTALESEKTYRAKQLRKGVQKNFWYKKGDTRLEVFLTGAEAEMVFEKQGSDQEIVEHLTDVKCYIQEELYYLNPEGGKVVQENVKDVSGLKPMQTVRYFEAVTARYHYTTETLVADNVKVSLFTASGHQIALPLEKVEHIMDGNGRRVQVSLVGKALNFTSDKFQGRFVD